MPYTLNINFPPTSPVPALGYRVRYWPTSTPASITTITVPTPPATITGLTDYSYTGDVSAICALNTYSTPFAFTATVPGPLTSTLVFIGYSAGMFSFALTNPLTVPLTIEYASVDGFDNYGCGIGSGVYLDTFAPSTTLTMPAGTTTGNIAGVGLGCAVLAYRRGAQIKIAGNPLMLSNGNTFTIGGTTVTVSIGNTCDPYLC